MIAHEVVQEFLNRKRMNSGKVKAHSQAYLDNALAKLQLTPEWVYPPFKHQLACFLLCMRFPRYFLMLDMGLGKTKIVLDVFQYRRREGTAKRMLTLVPQTTNLFAWQEQVKLHAPGLRVEILGPKTKPGERRRLLFEDDADVLVATYAGFTKMLSHKDEPDDDKKTRRKRVLVPNKKAIRDAARQFDFIVLDESDNAGNWQSLTFKVLRQFTAKIPHVYALSGTPFNGDPQRLWAQFFLVDRGETLGTSLGLLREALFEEKSNGFATVYKLPKRNETTLHRMCQHRGVRYEEGEANDLPPLIGGIDKPEIRYVDQSPMQARHSLRAHDELKEAHKAGNATPSSNAYCDMRAIAAGFVSHDGVASFFKPNVKMEALLSLIEELGDRQAIVFHHHRVVGEEIRAVLTKAKKKVAWAYGGQSDKDKHLAKFQSGKAQFLVANANSTAYGLNLQFCNVSIFFESPDDITTRKQAEKRTHRTGAEGTVFIYDIVARGTVDGKILTALKENKRVLDVVLDG